ncbi:MAG: TetR/AcrR family transcriptional regulator [Actinobacteria bacterium]|nr:TetR/AcrR family transcriptional regulator [Actinomycetota bacterium]
MTKRRSLDETRDVLLVTGAAMLDEHGPRITLDRITMIDVCREAGFKTAGSAYKIWPNQAAFHDDLLHHLISRSSPGDDALGSVAEMLAAHAPDELTLAEMIRIAGVATLAALEGGYPTYLVLWLARRTDPELSADTVQPEAEWFGVLCAFITGLMEQFDLEFVPPFDIEAFAVALSAIAEGMILRRRATPDLVPDHVDLPSGPDGTLQPWTPLAIGFKAIFDAWTRPKP